MGPYSFNVLRTGRDLHILIAGVVKGLKLINEIALLLFSGDGQGREGGGAGQRPSRHFLHGRQHNNYFILNTYHFILAEIET